MPRAKSSAKATDLDPGYVRMYYEHQFDRIEKLEGHAITISNFVLTISAAILTFGFNNKESFGPILDLLPIIIIVVNMSAILYVNDRARWVNQHQTRAKRILEIYIPELYKLEEETVAPPKKWAIYRRTVQDLTHYLFVVIGVLLLALSILKAYGVPLI
jgi:hypothetical protein